jgi:hypothetical protein
MQPVIPGAKRSVDELAKQSVAKWLRRMPQMKAVTWKVLLAAINLGIFPDSNLVAEIAENQKKRQSNHQFEQRRGGSLKVIKDRWIIETADSALVCYADCIDRTR